MSGALERRLFVVLAAKSNPALSLSPQVGMTTATVGMEAMVVMAGMGATTMAMVADMVDMVSVRPESMPASPCTQLTFSLATSFFTIITANTFP